MADTLGVIHATYDAGTGTVRGFLSQDRIDRRITNITIKGPARSTFRMYRGTSAVDSNQVTATPTGGGQDNTYDSTTDGAPILIPAATDILAEWSGGAIDSTSSATATVRMVY